MKKIALTLFVTLFALVSSGKDYSPLKFKGTDTERIQAAVNAAAAHGGSAVIPAKNPRGGDVWEIERAITLPANASVILDGCILQLTDSSRDNLFRSANVGEGVTNPKLIKNISIIGRGGAILRGADNPRSTGDGRRNLSTGDFDVNNNPQWNSYGTDGGKEGVKQTGDWRNIMILLAYVHGVEMKGFRIENAHAWAISFERVQNASLTHMQFYCPEVRTIAGKRKSVFNTDGIDLREGCKHFVISDMEFVTGDDPIALSALQSSSGVSGSFTSTMVTSKPHTGPEDDIEDVHISNIKTDCRGVAIRSSDIAGIHHIYIDNLVSSPVEGVTSLLQPFAVLLGNTNYGNAANPYTIHDIYISNLIGYGDQFIHIKSLISDCSFTNCIYTGGKAPEPFTYSVDKDSCRNIQVKNCLRQTATSGKEFITVNAIRMTSGDVLKAEDFPRFSKKNNSFTFKAKVEQFDSLTIGMGHKTYRARWIVVDKNEVALYNMEKSPVMVEKFKHGLDIKTFLIATLRQNNDGRIDLVIQTNGGYSRHELATTTDMNGIPQVICNAASLSEVSLSCGNADLKKDIWLFGDSYFGINSSRWPGVMKELGYAKGFYINGLAGQGSHGAYADLERALSFSTPKYLVWCLGMNDSDERWTEYFAKVRRICLEKGICLIASTVPTVPSRSKEAINKAVRESGLRYVDFSDAVGATPQGEWYDGCLYSDGVHPTAAGARLLAMRFLTDFPEITLTEHN